jgi:hypothetical protein
MDSKQFLKEMLEVGYRDGDKPTSKTIAKVKFELGYSGYCKGHSMVALFRSYQEPGKSLETIAAVKAHIKSLGGQSEAYMGVKFEVPIENVISFEAKYNKVSFVRAEDEKADFKEIFDAISELEIPINEWVWIAYKSIDSPTAVAKGEDGKFQPDDGSEARFRKIIVPVEKFANEQAARAAAGNSGGAVIAPDNSQWSDTARQNYTDLSELANHASEIARFYAQVAGKNPITGYELPDPLTPPTIKKQLAKIYMVETADIDILMSLDVAF